MRLMFVKFIYEFMNSQQRIITWQRSEFANGIANVDTPKKLEVGEMRR